MTKQKVASRRLTRAEKSNVRRKLGTLSTLRIPPNLRKKYGSAIDKFFAYLSRMNKDLPSVCDMLDDELCEYVEECWENGDPRGWCVDLMSGIAKFDPFLKGCYPLARAFVDTWKLHELPERAPPISLDLLKALVSYTVEVRKDAVFGACLMLTFHCMLRIGECLGLHSKDVIRSPASALLNLGLTKGGKRRNECESVEATDDTTIAFLDNAMRDLQPGDRIFPFNYQEFNKRFHELVSVFGLSSFNFKSHSLRRGGTTYEFRGHGSYDIICQRGRWANARTARLYIAEAVELTNTLAYSTKSNQLIRRHSTAFEMLVA
jgi:hypothetical protein